VRIVLCRVFDLSTKGAPHGEESKEKESEEEEVIFGRRNFKRDARDWRLDMSSRLLLALYAFLNGEAGR
jgi:hypothetical protein